MISIGLVLRDINSHSTHILRAAISYGFKNADKNALFEIAILVFASLPGAPWQISPCVNNGCIGQPSTVLSFALHYSLAASSRAEGIQMLLCISVGNTVVISKRVCIARASDYVSRMKSLRRSAPVDVRHGFKFYGPKPTLAKCVTHNATRSVYQNGR